LHSSLGSSMMQYTKSHGMYLWICCLILAGNTAAPMCLRGMVRLMHQWASPLQLDRCTSPLRSAMITKHIPAFKKSCTHFDVPKIRFSCSMVCNKGALWKLAVSLHLASSLKWRLVHTGRACNSPWTTPAWSRLTCLTTSKIW
jgi:hypothetical protein